MDSGKLTTGVQKHQPQSTQKQNYNMKLSILRNINAYYNNNLAKRIGPAFFNTFSIISPIDVDRDRFHHLLRSMFLQEKPDPLVLGLQIKESRAIASLLGLGICDALGASTEFIPFEKSRTHLIQHGFEDIRKQIKNKTLDSRHGRVGVWTDDCSMALCLADSLLLNKFQFNPKHLRYMFSMWLSHGLNNGGRPYSIGLGGNISISMHEFEKKQTEYAIEGDKFNNGNGSLMRLAPLPICFCSNINEALKYSGLQSRTTHNGEEAQECCRLLAALIVNLTNRQNHQNWKNVIDKTCQQFKTENKSVQCLSLSQQEPQELFEQQKKKYKGKFTKFNKKLVDRNWNWKDPQFTYSPSRTADMPGYVGSYCMDALSMALHTVWHNNSFKQIALMNANMGGDCDTVGAIAGQIGGAIYGVEEQMLKLYFQMDDCKYSRFDLFLKGYKLFNRSGLKNLEREEKEKVTPQKHNKDS